ncbi:hypothetical protein EG329_007841 [Mollisiaceae sp. DMI_Dod_QoI]|nr:hypothetical protein EG329_007841 [Helotiales sp. DMI_Dod_QoI]
MATKMKLNGLNNIHHTAGIFSDMTVDGPEIGTLVVIVDRAKNLPNRKTIGKQDPYCAARLGKEAKKTETDRRGGQTPRWDQELRYTVHDSPDYYQLKVSVFNDDKKTDLIGETWVDLKEVVVPGGGQNDIWHNLNCKGKYAGEIRLEITYYDTRPQQEKPDKSKQTGTNGVEEGGRESLRGPRQPKAPVKRRPLPSDPVSAAPAAPSVGIPDHVHTPPRGYPSSPTIAQDHGFTPPRGYREPSGIPDHIQTTQTPPRGYHSPIAAPELPTPPRGYQSPSTAPEHISTPPRGYQNPPSAIPEHVHTPTRGHQSPSYVPNQSPLQSVEYSTPPSHFSHSQGYESRSPTTGYGPSPGLIAATPTAQPMQNDRYEIYDPLSRNEYTPSKDSNSYRHRAASYDEQAPYGARYELAQPDEYGSPPSPDGPPPPPPAHRSRNGSTQVSPGSAMIAHGSYGFPSDSRSPAYSTPTHERSIPAYSQSNSYQAYSPEREQDQFRRSGNGYQQSPPRHHSYDSAYSTNYGSMQPTVEDAPPSPGGGNFSQPRHPRSRTSSYDDRRYDQVPSPAPLNLTNRGSSAASGRNSISTIPTPSHQYSSGSMGYTSATSSQLSSYRERSRDRSHTDASISSRTSYNSMPHQEQRSRGQSEDPSAAYSSYGIPPVPATLVAGMDPLIAQEISDRIYDEKRANINDPSRGRQQYQNQSQYEHNGRKLLAYHEPTVEPFVPAASTYDDRQSRFSTATVAVVKPRALSPDVRVPRKSVSPSPRPSDDQRRLSGVPFGPDSYNALNPAVSGSISAPSLSAAYDPNAPDPDAKIITHDGREVDPSDHIPESNYAPLLESKAPKYASQLPDRGYRPPLAGPPVSATGRRPLKQAGRPQSMSAMGPIYMSGGAGPDPTTPNTGRNRLQKKANRASAQPAPHSSPLAPISPYQDNSYAPKSLPRASTMDFNSSENYTPAYGNTPGYRGTAGPPPIPAKIPNGAPPHQSGGDAWALLEEMKNIDLGSGRARRRGY